MNWHCQTWVDSTLWQSKTTVQSLVSINRRCYFKETRTSRNEQWGTSWKREQAAPPATRAVGIVPLSKSFLLPNRTYLLLTSPGLFLSFKQVYFLYSRIDISTNTRTSFVLSFSKVGMWTLRNTYARMNWMDTPEGENRLHLSTGISPLEGRHSRHNRQLGMEPDLNSTTL